MDPERAEEGDGKDGDYDYDEEKDGRDGNRRFRTSARLMLSQWHDISEESSNGGIRGDPGRGTGGADWVHLPAFRTAGTGAGDAIGRRRYGHRGDFVALADELEDKALTHGRECPAWAYFCISVA